MTKTKKLAASIAAALAISTAMLVSLGGCAMIDNAINDIKGNLVGNGFVMETYDNYGELTMTTSGDKISLKGNRVNETTYSSEGEVVTTSSLSSVITVNIDGKEVETCGDTVIFAEKGLEKDLDIEGVNQFASSDDGDLLDNTLFSYSINRFENMIGKSRAVVIKSQMGRPLCVYSGDEVYYEVRDDLPKTTKLMVDGKALYIHRANFQIIDTELLGQ